MKRNHFLHVLVLSTVVVLIVATVAIGATTISTNINTAGTLSVTGASTLTGAVTTGGALTVGTDLTVTNYTNLSYASTTNASTTLLTIGATNSATTTVISGLVFGTCAFDFESINASSTAVTTCVAAGVTSSHKVFLTPVSLEQGLVLVSASSTANNTIQLAVLNTGYGATYGVAINPAAATWYWMGIK